MPLLRELQGEEFYFIDNESSDMEIFKETLYLDDDVTGLVIETGSLENGGFEADDKIFYTYSSLPCWLNAFYEETTYGKIVVTQANPLKN